MTELAVRAVMDAPVVPTCMGHSCSGDCKRGKNGVSTPPEDWSFASRFLKNGFGSQCPDGNMRIFP